jgi:hypothetical protein
VVWWLLRYGVRRGGLRVSLGGAGGGAGLDAAVWSER